MYVLLTANIVAAVATGVASLAVTLGAVVGLDAIFYGRWTVSSLAALSTSNIFNLM